MSLPAPDGTFRRFAVQRSSVMEPALAAKHPEIATYSIFLAFGAAALSGLFFGTYPAARAASLRPIEALRFE